MNRPRTADSDGQNAVNIRPLKSLILMIEHAVGADSG